MNLNARKSWGSHLKILSAVILSIVLLLGCEDKTTPSFPEEYRNVLLEFKEIIDDIVDKHFEEKFNEGGYSSPDENFASEWGSMLIEMNQQQEEFLDEQPMYSLKDLNNDGISELLFSGEGDRIFAIFTLKEGSPKLLGAFWSKHKCTILNTGELYVLDVGGAQDFEYSICTIDAETNIIKLKQFGCQQGLYYLIENGIKRQIEKNTFDEMLELYPYDTRSTAQWLDQGVPITG